jgi:hypothetical protein
METTKERQFGTIYGTALWRWGWGDYSLKYHNTIWLGTTNPIERISPPAKYSATLSCTVLAAEKLGTAAPATNDATPKLLNKGCE